MVSALIAVHTCSSLPSRHYLTEEETNHPVTGVVVYSADWIEIQAFRWSIHVGKLFLMFHESIMNNFCSMYLGIVALEFASSIGEEKIPLMGRAGH
ncbi:hypothetical protein AVEN_28174-1 [Araneus ventricosus]|uniref:Uncharacterized protein n=1 Tax=Araneus ventricosus TaxID=182803 RepID=A0A4Y2VMP5_ARAVE|nr:hypothetical protein AVEN_232367-1 [Araneus ventricosus]GBO24970.1 hypothetical protein AVEN_28174-1 [Araneus ventricosus]